MTWKREIGLKTLLKILCDAFNKHLYLLSDYLIILSDHLIILKDQLQ